MSSVLLSIDWDWVTGDCSVGQHGCCGWCSHPHNKMSRGSERHLNPNWSRRLELLLKLKPSGSEARLWVAECHADILSIVEPERMLGIIHKDSHTDNESWFGLCCGSWRTFLPSRVKSYDCSDDELKGAAFHDVFVCLSSPWTPPSFDVEFWCLIRSLSDACGRDPVFIGHRHTALERSWEQVSRRIEPEERPGA